MAAATEPTYALRSPGGQSLCRPVCLSGGEGVSRAANHSGGRTVRDGGGRTDLDGTLLERVVGTVCAGGGREFEGGVLTEDLWVDGFGGAVEGQVRTVLGEGAFHLQLADGIGEGAGGLEGREGRCPGPGFMESAVGYDGQLRGVEGRGERLDLRARHRGRGSGRASWSESGREGCAWLFECA